MVEDSKGKTSKAHYVNKLFSSSVNRENLDILDQKVSQGIRTRILSNFQQNNQRGPVVGQHGGGLTVTPDAENWLKNNLGVTIENGEPSEIRPSRQRMKRTFSARPGFRTNNSEKGDSIRSGVAPSQLTKENLERFEGNYEPTFKIRSSNKKRPMSAYSGGSRRSRAFSAKSAASHVPKMLRATALSYCNKIATKAVLDQVKSSRFSARDKLSPTEIQQILQNSGIHMEIATVRGFLNHLNFTPHGKS